MLVQMLYLNKKCLYNIDEFTLYCFESVTSITFCSKISDSHYLKGFYKAAQGLLFVFLYICILNIIFNGYI